MNVLLLFPKQTDTFWNLRRITRFFSKKGFFPPLGLLTVASLLPQEWNKKLVDLNINELNDEDLEWADVVFISAIITQGAGVEQILKRCKAKNKTTVAGGPFFRTAIERAYLPGIDHVIIGEAETTLPTFIRDFENGCAKPLYEPDGYADITKIPIPSWSLIDLNDYGFVALQYSRGCQFNCEFCEIVEMYGHTFRAKKPEQLVAELQSVYDHGFRGRVWLSTDNITANSAQAKETLPHIIEWQKKHGYPFVFGGEVSANLVDDEELMNLMAETNFDQASIGIETPNVDSLKECHKGHNVSRDMYKVVRTLNQHGLAVLGNFIVGFDHDTENIFNMQADFMKEAGVVVASVNMLQVRPETQLWHRLAAEGRLIERSKKNLHYDSAGLNLNLDFIPRMGAVTLIEGYKKLVLTLYSREHFYERMDTFFKDFRPRTKYSFSKPMLMALLKSIWIIGIIEKGERRRFWKYFLKTCLTNIESLPMMLTNIIVGHHLRLFTQDLAESTFTFKED